MGPVRSRVVELWMAGDPVGRCGSGYLVGGRHVLTAAHVVETGTTRSTVRAEVRCLGHDRWMKTTVAWRERGLDLALLEIEEPGWEAPAPVPMRWGRLWGVQPVSFTA